ncbi:hypothetical protein C4M96_01335 [Mycoplasmopsis pullorum]|uniref:hypothetical protein n=2 Tax=Mycoplasmopsis pullorum TaxID=48003 RepID=UPI0015D5FCA3|nr:hypothetical protein [Mycoplasmopsis pullorum]TNK82950.1 hypothetical protein C4M93_03250 [Mycoplasmopsis pullorum]TNK92276.1 hypothetical protein C4M96_01335 [Mycoplasmopsis pullorum]
MFFSSLQLGNAGYFWNLLYMKSKFKNNGWLYFVGYSLFFSFKIVKPRKNKENENIIEVLDTKDLIASLNDLEKLTKTYKWNKFTKEQKDAINAAISNSNNILDNLDKHTNGYLKEQTQINKLLLNTKVNSKIWWLLTLTTGTIATMGLIFIILRKVEDEY